jgi:hypothetical protein
VVVVAFDVTSAPLLDGELDVLRRERLRPDVEQVQIERGARRADGDLLFTDAVVGCGRAPGTARKEGEGRDRQERPTCTHLGVRVGTLHTSTIAR